MLDTEQESPVTLAQLLRQLRAGRDAGEVADAIGVRRSSVYFWEQTSADYNRRRPSAQHLQKLLDHYEASDADRLLAWQLVASPVSPPAGDA